MTVTQKQCLLTFLGYDTGGVDGIWGEKSRHATECCQEDLGIPVDGVWGGMTETAVLEAVYTYDLDAPVAEDINVSGTTGNTELDERFRGIRYWGPEELRCQCGGKYCNGFPALPDRTLLELVDDIRHEAGSPAIRTSGLRCATWNTMQKGVSNSKHMSGKALDFYIPGLSGNALLQLVQSDSRTRYAYVIQPGEPYVHVDVK